MRFGILGVVLFGLRFRMGIRFRCCMSASVGGGAIFADDTPVRLQTPRGASARGKTRMARLWVYARDERPWRGTAPPAACYRFGANRKGGHPRRHLAGFRGWIHADGYAGFAELCRTGRIREAPCMAHVRRKFVDLARNRGAPVAREAVERIAALYRRRGRSPRADARRACPYPPGQGQAPLRRPRNMARPTEPEHTHRDAAGRRHPLRPLDWPACAPASDVTAPPSNAAATAQPSTGWKPPSAVLHSVCCGEPLCAAICAYATTLYRTRSPDAPNPCEKCGLNPMVC